MPLDPTNETGVIEWAIGLLIAGFGAAWKHTNARLNEMDKRRGEDDDKLWRALQAAGDKAEKTVDDMRVAINELRNDLMRNAATRADLDSVKRDLKDDFRAHEARVLNAIADIRRPGADNAG